MEASWGLFCVDHVIFHPRKVYAVRFLILCITTLQLAIAIKPLPTITKLLIFSK